MDAWVVAAAAVVGYIVQHCKNIVRNRQQISQSSSGNSQLVRSESPSVIRDLWEKSCPLRKLVKRKQLRKNGFRNWEPDFEDASTAEVASTSGIDEEEMVLLGNYEECNVHFVSNLSSGVVRTENLLEYRGEVAVNSEKVENSSDLLPMCCKGEMGFSYCSARNRSVLSSRRMNGQIIKPLNSLESCVISLLYTEHAKMKDYINSIPLPSTPNTSPLLITDGSSIIGRQYGDSVSMQIRVEENNIYRETCPQENRTVCGIPYLPNIDKSIRKGKMKARKEHSGRCNSSANVGSGKLFNLHRGRKHVPLIFCIGITVGIIYSFLENKWEVEKLNALLKQSENLVQDLQEELEMKDTLTVKELATEDYETPDGCRNSYNNRAPHMFAASDKNSDISTKHDNELHAQKSDVSFESRSKIEAELEAELERLELNMSSSCLEENLSNVVELDEDFVPHVAHGELRVDIFNQQAGAQVYADRDGSGSSTHHSGNYAVSPCELSLRLHEFLRTRLEERIAELEIALQNSQRKVQYLKSVHITPWKELGDAEVASSFNQESSISDKENKVGQPVVIDSSGEVLETYCEASTSYNLASINGSEQQNDDLLLEARKSNHHRRLDQNLHGVCDVGFNGSMPLPEVMQGRPPVICHCQKIGGHDSSSNDDALVRDQSDDDDDEAVKMIIKQFVEKSKKNSPSVFSAQRLSFPLDDSEHGNGF